MTSKLYMLLLLLLIPWIAGAKELEFDYFSPEKNKRISVIMVEYKDKKISKDCIKSGKVSCQAWSATHKRNVSSNPRSSIPVLGHPAAQNCHALGASNRLIKDKQKREYDICYFKDGSFIDAWDLYNGTN